MNMIDKKDPRQNYDNDDSSDDEVIIDLTEEIDLADEVDIEPKADNSVLKSAEEMNIDDPLSLKLDGAPEAENDEKFLAFDEIDESESAKDDAGPELAARTANAQEDPAEDHLFASAMEYPPGTDENEDREITEEFDLSADEDDDIITLDMAHDETDEKTEVIELMEEEVDRRDSPDLDDVSGLEFEDKKDANENPAMVEHGSKSSDDIFARAVEQYTGSDDEPNLIDLAREADFSLEDEDEFPDMDELPEDDDELMALSEEKPLKFEDNVDLLDFDENADLEDDFKVPMDGFNGVEAADEREIIEITEFDQHFPEDDEALLKKSGMVDRTAEDEDEFLELIDVDENNVPEDEEILEFGESPLIKDDSVLDQFLSEELKDDDSLFQATETIFGDEKEDKLAENDASKTIFDESPETDSGNEDEILKIAAELDEAESDRTPAAGTVLSEEEEFKINLDPGTISKQIDRLDPLQIKNSSDDSAAALLSADWADEKPTGPKDSQAGPETEGSLPLSSGQIDAAIERVIKEKFSGTIEDIIYEVIEKAVAKEINRLKRSLLGNNATDDDQI